MTEHIAHSNGSIVSLRACIPSDLPIFFEQQQDDEANWMVAFTRKDPRDRDAFMRHWERISKDPSVENRTILYDEQVAGSIFSYVGDELPDPEVGYWLGRAYWGKGIATKALSLFLDAISHRPLYAHIAKDNVASQRVLETCGFVVIGEGAEFANARGCMVEELIMRLDEAARS